MASRKRTGGLIGLAVVLFLLSGCESFYVDRGEHASFEEAEQAIEIEMTGWLESVLGPGLEKDIYIHPEGCHVSGWAASGVEIAIWVQDPLAARERLVAWLIAEEGAEDVRRYEPNGEVAFRTHGDPFYIDLGEADRRNGSFSVGGWTECYRDNP